MTGGSFGLNHRNGHIRRPRFNFLSQGSGQACHVNLSIDLIIVDVKDVHSLIHKRKDTTESQSLKFHNYVSSYEIRIKTLLQAKLW
jgi:hypothetical protein